jgi:nucleotide-binding universal stress UspA family protein
MTGAAKEIVAGYDGSPDSQQALDWAAREARLHHGVLTVCHAWTPGLWPPGGQSEDPGRLRGTQLLAEGMRRAGSGLRPGEIRQVLVPGPATRALCELSSPTAMLVVGSRGLGGLAGLLLGSVSLQVAACASGPVTVVRGHWRPVPGLERGPVIVGADGSGAAQSAVEFAFEEAARRKAPLTVVCALADAPGVLGGARRVEADVEEVLAKYEPDYPDVRVTRLVQQGAPRAALLEAAARAQLLVVGARGRGGLPEMTLGSVSLAVLHHAPCPVTVIR